MRNWLKQACEESGLSNEECAALLGRTSQEFAFALENPGTLTLNELRALRSSFAPPARKTLWKALCELRP